MIIPTAALLCLLLQTSKGAIEGTVINSVTDKPIAAAQVQATRIPGPTAGATGFAGGTFQVPTGIVGGVTVGTPFGMVVREGGTPVQIPPATADANGHFAFVDLEPGTYLLRAFADGYA